MNMDATTDSRDNLVRVHLVVRGLVQGVGFRPHLYRLAREHALLGWIRNGPGGVVAELQGRRAGVEQALRSLRAAPPGLARIEAVEADEIPVAPEIGLRILTSDVGGHATTPVLPDVATCPQCLMEMADPDDRRFGYPFINCTQCGPRYSIIESLPYDRDRTSMRHFPMCARCLAEYADPANRRFHAEPNACPDCGPSLTLWDAAGHPVCGKNDALVNAARAIGQGMIVAVKGLGGFHLIADARNQQALARLRAAKQRPEKPFAVMFGSLDEVRRLCRVSPVEARLLDGRERPIVLVRRRRDGLARAVAGACPWLGVMLPYTPLHHLLLRQLGFPVVATSGNRHEEPIVTGNAQALEQLRGIAGLFLVHDRPIARALDDSVVREVCGRELVLRHGRGYAPTLIKAGAVPAGILAVGGHEKTTIALSTEMGVILSQHIGELETVETRVSHGRVAHDLARLHAVPVRRAAHDAHPDYASTRAAIGLGVARTPVQHHVAHVLSCMAEQRIPPPVLGVAWDGTGHGTDNTVWGGEFLLVGRTGWRRVAHLRPFPLPGAAAAMREPRRAALGLLFAAFGEDAFRMTDLPPVAAFEERERRVLRSMLRRRVNAPFTSSVGRLFDAYAALAGLYQRTSHEGQAAAALEGLAGSDPSPCHEFSLAGAETGEGGLMLDWQPALQQLLLDLRAGVDARAIATALHNGLAQAIGAVAARMGEERVALTGGCFQNARLTEAAVAALRAVGCQPFWHRRVPPNDGGLALGQAVWAGWMEAAGEAACVSRFPA